MTDRIHVAAAAMPIRPMGLPTSKVASNPSTRTPNASPGGRPAAAAITTSEAGPPRSGSSGKHAARIAATASVAMPATSPSGLPTLIPIRANPPRPGITSPRYARRVLAPWARAAAPNATNTPIPARAICIQNCGNRPSPIS